MIMQALREATRPYHDQMEHALDLMDAMSTPEGYCLTLKRFYSFYQPVEAQLEKLSAGERERLDTEVRRKAPLLVADLKALGVEDLEKLPLCPDVPVIEDFHRALGCLYVMEGSTLGGQMIAKVLKERFELTPDHGATFFNSYGDQVGRMWKAFGALLTEAAPDDVSRQRVVEAACDMFQCLIRWFEQAETVYGQPAIR